MTCAAHICVNSTCWTFVFVPSVSPRGSVSVDPPLLIAYFEENSTFSCSGEGGPNNTYQWFEDNQILSLETSPNITVYHVNSTRGGEFSCTVSNAAGNETESSILYIRPYFVVRPETEIRSAEGESVVFTCIAEGFPQPNITWFKQNLTDIIPFETGNTLEFSPVVFGDEGIYICTASSSIRLENGTVEIFSTQVEAILTGTLNLLNAV